MSPKAGDNGIKRVHNKLPGAIEIFLFCEGLFLAPLNRSHVYKQYKYRITPTHRVQSLRTHLLEVYETSFP